MNLANSIAFKTLFEKNRAFLTLAMVTLAVLSAVVYEHVSNLDNSRSQFKRQLASEAALVAQKSSHTFAMLYQGLRTVSRLSATRQIDRYGTNLDAIGKLTMQEIYNNLFSNLRLSEFYIVPAGFDPDKIDPQTGKPEEPIITFDEFIVGRLNAEKGVAKKLPEFEEIEIHEYRVMRDHLIWFEDNYPRESQIRGLVYPALSSPEVITCDNSFLDPLNPNDQARAGVVYSVPFYDPNGGFKGIVSGVVLSSILQETLPNEHYVYHNSMHGYTVAPKQMGPWQKSLELINASQPNPDLLYSTIIPLSIPDSQAQWNLWVGVPEAKYWALPEIKSHQNKFIVSIIAVIVLSLAACYVIVLHQRQQRLMSKQQSSLEEKIKQRTFELEQTNNKLNRSSQLKSEFLSRISHEFRTPLNAIIGYSEIILEDATDNSDQPLASDSQKIHDSAIHLLSLVNNVLDISKIEAGKMEVVREWFDLHTMLKEVLSPVMPLVEKNRNQFELHIDDNISSIHCDQVKLRQILVNLLANAAKFTRDGRIELTCFAEHQTSIVFVVSDTGIGMHREQLNKVFDEFIQADNTISRDYGGSGLGLSICKKYCTLMDGEISAVSEPGKGSRFKISLPAKITYKNSKVAESIR